MVAALGELGEVEGVTQEEKEVCREDDFEEPDVGLSPMGHAGVDLAFGRHRDLGEHAEFSLDAVHRELRLEGHYGQNHSHR